MVMEKWNGALEKKIMYFEEEEFVLYNKSTW